jgi:Cdc6-like AAA superfamily ATPase
MDRKPKCIVITGRPGSGKTTLTDKLSKQLYVPKISRDELKEGYVNTFEVKHDLLPKETNRVVNDIFKKVIVDLLESQVSLIIEAAFDHKIWEYFIPGFMKISDLYILICDVDAEQSARRHLERGLANPKREYFHGDKRVSVYRETGVFEPGEEYIAPDFSVPTMNILTLNDYSPTLEEIEKFIRKN